MPDCWEFCGQQGRAKLLVFLLSLCVAGALIVRIIEVKEPASDPNWSRLIENHVNPSALVSASYLEYQKAYHAGRLFSQHLAFVEHAGAAICGTAFDVFENGDGTRTLDATYIPSAQIWGAGVPAEERCVAADLLTGHIVDLIPRYDATRLRFADQLLDGVVSPLGLWALERNATESPRWWQTIDLTKTEAALWTDLRRRFKGSINNTRRRVDVGVSRTREAFDGLRALHLKAAGRATRSDESWELQWKAIEEGANFITTASADGIILSASYFLTTKNDCYYGVGASDRNFFELSLSHAPMWAAIVHAKELGCLRFHTGEQVWEADGASHKEAAISDFKRGFGGQTMPELIIDLDLKRSSAA
jgi:hypothetical protein